MPSGATSIRPKVTVNGRDIIVDRLSVTRGAYGSNGHFHLTASIQYTQLDINELAKNADVNQRTTVTLQMSNDGGKTYSPLLTGDLDEVRWDYDEDELTMTGRDFSGRLVESRVVLKDTDFTNRTPSQLATEFANDVGLIPNVTPVPNEQPIGYLGENNLAIRTGTPITKWSLLILMARLSGRAVWVTATNPPTLFFGPVNLSTSPRIFTYGQKGKAPGTPIRKLQGEYHLFKNTTFQVVVMSYHPQMDKPVTATVMVAGETFSYETTKTIKPGMYKAGASGTTRLQIGAALKNKPGYFFYMHGLTPTECQARAEAIARDIAKRQFIMHGEIDGDPTINPLDPVQINAATPSQLNMHSIATKGVEVPVNIGPFNNRLMYVNSVTHEFSFTSGFLTKLSFWHLPSASAALTDANLTGTAQTEIPVE